MKRPCRDCVALVDVRAENERLKDFISGCIKLGGEQRAEIEEQRRQLLAVSAAFNSWANGGGKTPRVALADIGRALGEPF